MVESLIKMSKEGDFLGKCPENIKRNSYALNNSDDWGSNYEEDFDDTSSNDDSPDPDKRKRNKLSFSRSNSRKSVRQLFTNGTLKKSFNEEM